MRWSELIPHIALTFAVSMSTLALALMPLLGMQPMVWAIIAWLAVMAFRSINDGIQVPPRAWPWFLLLAAPFLLMLIDLPRAPDLLMGWRAVERSASLIVFPIGFLLLGAPAHQRMRDVLVDLFAIASLILALFANGVMLSHGFNTDLPPVADFSFAYRAAFSSITGLHPPYASYFFLGAALFQIVRVFDPYQRKWWRLAMIIALALAALLVASRTPLFAFTAACILVLFMRLRVRTAWAWSIAVIVIIAASSLFVPSIGQRTHQVITTIVSPTGSLPVNSVNIRIPIAHCTRMLIAEHPLLGIGQANAQPAMDACYQQFNIPLLLDGSYGTHCQPLHWWLCFGVAGLLLFFLLFVLPMRLAWKRCDAAHFGFLVFILICCATENVLARQWGVVLFACFNTLFVASGIQTKEEV